MSPSATIFDSILPSINNLPKVSIWSFLSRQHPASVDSDHAVYIDERSTESFSHQRVFDISRMVGFVLLHRIGLQKGDTIILYSENTIKYPVVVLASQMAGLICSPASAAYLCNELAYQIVNSQAKVVLASRDKYAVALAACREAGIPDPILIDGEDPGDPSLGPSIWDMMNDSNSLSVVELSPQQAVATTTLLCYSSGTSGMPKGVKISHFNLTSAILQSQAMSPASYSSRETWIACLPLSHLYGLFMHVYMALFTGAKVIVMNKFLLNNYAAVIQKYSVTACHIVPPIAIRLAKDLEEGYDFSSVQEWRSAAAPLGQEAAELLHHRYGIPLHSIYAMTETTAVIAHTCRNSSVKPSSVGYLAPNMKAKIVDGELRLKGPNIMLGYHNHASANEETFDEDGFMRTGDVVRIDKDGFIYVVDRIKEIIKYNGYQVPPAELEDILLSHKEITDAAVVGLRDTSTGTEYPTAFVVLSGPDKSEAELEALRNSLLAHVSSQVAHYKYLRGGVRFVNSIPKSPSGKILRKVLRDCAKTQF